VLVEPVGGGWAFVAEDRVGVGLCGGGVGDIGCVLQVNLFEFDKGFDCLAFDDIWRDLGGW
jgi:hypothetical protein